MFRPLALYIGLRYTKAHRRKHFISFISLTSMGGIALGVAVLITVLSVMNGFNEEISKRFFSMVPEITIEHLDGGIADWQKLKKQLGADPQIVGIAPITNGQGILSAYGRVLPAAINGILPSEESRITDVSDKLVKGKLSDLKPGNFDIILGKKIADTLGVTVGDNVTLMIPAVNVTLAGVIPRFKQFHVVGIFSAGTGFNFDKSLAFIHMNDAQKLFMYDNTVSGVRVKIHNIYDAPLLAKQILMQLPEGYIVSNWTDQFGAFFKAIQLEKTMMFLILILIIAVAAFNLVSSLVMVVVDKQADIAILRTIGATPKQILTIFIVQGCILGIAGTLLGLLFGITLALNVTALVNWLQQVLHVHFLSSLAYFVDYLPSKLSLTDIVNISGVALLLSFVATLYPAWRAAAIQPAEALRYE